METQLAKSTSGFLVGDRLTIADISCWGWVNSHGMVPQTYLRGTELIGVTSVDWAGVSLDEFPNLASWVERIQARKASSKGANVPKSSHKKQLTDEEKEKLAKEASAWILQGNEHTAKK